MEDNCHICGNTGTLTVCVRCGNKFCPACMIGSVCRNCFLEEDYSRAMTDDY